MYSFELTKYNEFEFELPPILSNPDMKYNYCLYHVMSTVNNFLPRVKKEGMYVKTVAVPAHEFELTKKFISDVQPLNVTPLIYSFEKMAEIKIFEDREYIHSLCIYRIEMEEFGKSLDIIYEIEEGYHRPGPTALDLRENEDLFDEFLPIPDDVKKQVRSILEKILLVGWNYSDTHPGNFVLRDGIVKIIDYDFVQRA